MKIAIVQMNPIVGALDKNCKAILAHAEDAKKSGAHLAVFPELSLLGYPPKDLLCRVDFLTAQNAFIETLSAKTPLPIIFGAAIREPENPIPYNAALLAMDGTACVVGRKSLLPNYNVFDEKRYFRTPDTRECGVFSLNQKKFLISICEDAWACIALPHVPPYADDPIKNAIRNHGPIDFIINLSASPFAETKPAVRDKIFTHLAKTYRVPLLLAGQVGANDQLLFDGHSMVIDAQGTIMKRAKPCVEDIIVYDDTKPDEHSPQEVSPDDLLIECLTMGIRDYITKCRASGVIIGISGGIDSAVVAALAVRALGPARVRGVFLPSQYTSEQSLIEAQALARNLSIPLTTYSIQESVNLLRMQLESAVGPAQIDLVDQNLQSRVRGLIIMALTNAHGDFMIATSNKSEIAVGYTTIYGDMCGAFSPLGDLYKTDVVRLAHALNKHRIVIPESTIARKPTAELKPNQLDTDTLPEYEILDAILRRYIDHLESAEAIAKNTKIPREEIDRVIAMVARAEYKRRQGPFCLMVSDRVFGDALRFPIAQQVPKLS